MPLHMLPVPFWLRYLLVVRDLERGLVCALELRLGSRLLGGLTGRLYVNVGGMAVGMDWELRRSGQVLLSSTGISIFLDTSEICWMRAEDSPLQHLQQK